MVHAAPADARGQSDLDLPDGQLAYDLRLLGPEGGHTLSAFSAGAIVGLVLGLVVAYVVSIGSLLEDCTQLEATVIKGVVYDCKRRD